MKKNEARRAAGFRQETVKLPAVKIHWPDPEWRSEWLGALCQWLLLPD